MSFSSRLTFRARLAEVKTFGDALGDTGRFQALVDPIHAEITLDRLAGLRVPLGCSPGAGRNACFAAHAKFIVHKNYTVLRPFLHRTGRAGGDTPGILAVKTGHKHIGHARQVVYFSGADGYYLGQSRPDRQIVFCFTM